MHRQCTVCIAQYQARGYGLEGADYVPFSLETAAVRFDTAARNAVS